MKKILVAVDFSDLATTVIDHAAKFAKAFDSEVFILHVETPAPAFIGNEMSAPIMPEHREEEVKRVIYDLKAMAQYLEQMGIATSFEYQHGLVADTILEKARLLDVGLIIMGAHSHGFLYRAFIGSISTGVLKLSPCPVLVIPEK
jgi:nucleotide-binding universal stress UspA family protein